MTERSIDLGRLNPAALFGVNNSNLKKIKTFFPKLSVIARGSQIVIKGDEETMDVFEMKINLLIHHLKKFDLLTENNIENLMLIEGDSLLNTPAGGDTIVYGNSGLKITARTVNQKKLVQAIQKNDMVFVSGPAGSGKTYTAVAMAVRALKAKEVRRIILSRPAVEAGENLGFLPGDLKEKLDPYLMPLYDALRDMIPPEKLNDKMQLGVIEIAPLAFMRGRTLDKAFVILDEAQNTTIMQMKMFLTRMGTTAKFVITGDMSQVDLPSRQRSGLSYAKRILEGIDGIGMVEMEQSDIIRHPLISKIINAFEVEELKEEKNNDDRRIKKP
ncbi:MAG: PhoH family protein [Flavobacteriales bacterium]